MSSRFWITCSLASSSRLSFSARFFNRTNKVSRFGQARWKTFSTSIIWSMIFAWLTFRGIPSSTRVSMSGLNLWASTAASIASFQSSTVISSGTSWPLLEYSRKALPTSVRVSIERKTSPQGQWKKRGILPSVLPCVPLPLPGAPKRMNVLYFMRGTFFYKTTAHFGQQLSHLFGRHPELRRGIPLRYLKAYSCLGPTSPPPDRHSLVVPPDRSARSHRPAQKWCSRDQVRRFYRAKISSPVAAQ